MKVARQYVDLLHFEEKFGRWPRALRVAVRPFLNAHTSCALLWGMKVLALRPRPGSWGVNVDRDPFVDGVWAARDHDADAKNRYRFAQWRLKAEFNQRFYTGGALCL